MRYPADILMKYFGKKIVRKIISKSFRPILSLKNEKSTFFQKKVFFESTLPSTEHRQSTTLIMPFLALTFKYILNHKHYFTLTAMNRSW